jgi:hypothetical protein
MPRAQSADGVFHDFPDGTDQTVIDRVMKTYAQRATPSAEPEAHTTASGLAAAAGRGLAPYAAGAAIGAAAGAPFAGIGAVPGAAAGVAATGLAELGTAGFNAAARALGLEAHVTTPSGATDKLLDAGGIKRPSTTTERLTENVAGDVAGLAGGLPGLRGASRVNPEKAAAQVDSLYGRGIKPSIRGRRTTGQVEGYQEQTRQAVETIIASREGGALPRTVAEFRDAIGETKTKVLEGYTGLAREATEKGERVDLKALADEVAALAKSPEFNTSRTTVSYIQREANHLRGLGAYTPAEAQEAIRGMNARLKSFYANPGGGGNAQVDAAIAEKMRGALDGALERAGVSGYRELKAQYGALSRIENDVGAAANRQASGKGNAMLDWATNVGSLMEGAHAVYSHSVEDALAAAAIKGAGEFAKRTRNPDHLIKTLFERADKARTARSSPSEGFSLGRAAVGTAPLAGNTMQELADRAEQIKAMRAAQPAR